MKEKNVMENAVFQIKEAIGCSQKFFEIGVRNTATFTGNTATFTGKILCWSHFLIKFQSWKNLQLCQKETPARVFSSKICEFFKNTLF